MGQLYSYPLTKKDVDFIIKEASDLKPDISIFAAIKDNKPIFVASKGSINELVNYLEDCIHLLRTQPREPYPRKLKFETKLIGGPKYGRSRKAGKKKEK